MSFRTARRAAVCLAATIAAVVLFSSSCRRSGSNAPATANGPSTTSIVESSSESTARLIELIDCTSSSGVAFVHHDGSVGRHDIVETISCGLALFDYDGDGLIDIYFPNGRPIDGAPTNSSPRHALFKNLGGMKFRDVTVEAGVACTSFGLGGTVGDYDNDGHPDLYLSNFGPNILYHNNGDGTFTDVTPESKVDRGSRVGAGVCFLDIDADGDLDLFAANYVKFTAVTPQTSKPARSVYPSPLDYPPESNSLFRNEGDGRWSDVSDSSGISAKLGTGMGAIACDIDDDGDSDICVANDEMANFLYRNDGQGQFEESGVYAAIAFDGLGAAQGSMGIDAGDYDNDGRRDLYVTAYLHERATLYQNRGQALFQDVSQQTRAGEGTQQNVTWGCCFADFDNDSDRDLFVATGHLDERDSQDAYLAPDLVLQNRLVETGDARFENISLNCGDGPRLRRSSRGSAVDDLDNDGDLDVVVLNTRAPAAVLENQWDKKSTTNHWLQVQVHGVHENRDAVGAKVRVVLGDLVLFDEVHSGRGYQSHWGSRLHFGLGGQNKVDRIEVQWSTGHVQVVRNLAADQFITIVEE